jgi:undecaprenyl-diphosphatase
MPDTGNSNAELPGVERASVPSMRAALVSLAAAVLALLLFSWLAHEVFEGDMGRFDDSVRGWVHQFASPPLTRAMHVISSLGSGILMAVLVIALVIFIRTRWRSAAIWLLVTMAGGLVLEWTLKYSFQRTRPTPFFSAVPPSYSFPSGHALMSFCMYGVLAGLLTARMRSTGLRVLVWLATAVLVAAIGLSRIYLGVHYPSDVLAGYLAAGVWVSALVAADRMRQRKRLRAMN